MLRSFLKQALTFGAAQMVARFVSLAVVPIYAYFLDPAELGALDLLLIGITIINSVCCLEIHQGLARMYQSAAVADRPGYAATALWITSLASVGGAGLVCLAAPAIADALHLSSSTPIFFAAATAVAVAIFGHLQGQLRWAMRPLASATATVAASLATGVIGIWLVGTMQWGASGPLAATLFGNILGVLVAWRWAARDHMSTFHRSHMGEMLRFSLPLVVSTLAAIATQYADRYLLAVIAGTAEVGLYGMAFRVASITTIALIGIQWALTPLIYQRLDDPQTPNAIARIARLCSVPALVIGMFLAGLAGPIIGILAPPEYASASRAVPALVIAQLAIQSWVFAPGLAIAKCTKLQAAIMVGGALLSCGAAAVGSSWGASGAAWSAALSAVVTTAFLFRASQRLYFIPYPWPRISAAAVIATLTVCGSWHLAVIHACLTLALGSAAITAILLWKKV